MEDPFGGRHGGTIRTLAFRSGLEKELGAVEIAFPKPTLGVQSLAADRAVGPQDLKTRAFKYAGRFKRRYLPMPTMAGARDKELATKVRATPANVVVISALAQAPYGDETPAATWLDFMDMWSAFAGVEAFQRRGLARVTATAQSQWLLRQEQRYGRKARVVTAAGWRDYERLRNLGIDATWLPTPLADEEFRRVGSVNSRGRTAGLLGNFRYWPNRAAYDDLVRGWLPALKAQGWRVVVAGRGSEELRVAEGVELLGELNDINDFYRQVDASLAPIVLGGGMKVKVVESLSRGIPVVATPQAVEGLPPVTRELCATVSITDAGSLPEPGQMPVVDPDHPALADFRFSEFSRRLGKLCQRL